MAELHVLRVFTGAGGAWGNPLGVFLDGGEIGAARRQSVATELGFSETVFVDDREAGRIAIYTPALELPFAGHPTVGTAWLLAAIGEPVAALRPPAGEIEVGADAAGARVSAPASWEAPYEYRRIDSPAEVDALDAAAFDADVYAWAWIDEATGTVRARSFAPGAGIVEDEATGSAALTLCARLERPIEVHQGRGSVISASPVSGERIEIAGRVALDGKRRFPVDG